MRDRVQIATLFDQLDEIDFESIQLLRSVHPISQVQLYEAMYWGKSQHPPLTVETVFQPIASLKQDLHNIKTKLLNINRDDLITYQPDLVG